MERDRLERLDQAYNIFNSLQILATVIGICAAFAAWGTLYMICLFGQAVGMILFGIISSNLVAPFTLSGICRKGCHRKGVLVPAIPNQI